MESIQLGNSGIAVSRLAFGCMRLVGDGSAGDRDKGKRAVQTAVDSGYTLFDHADIYAQGACETLFGEVLKASPSLRDNLTILTKCGIRPAPVDDATSVLGRYDFSAGHLMASVEGSLQRLGIEQIDFLLLHRPDYLMDACEVATVFDRLHRSGKVAHFGVSNFSPSQLSLLQSATRFHLQANQVEINIDNVTALRDGTLDQCMMAQMTPLAWCPIAGIAYPAWGSEFSEQTTRRVKDEADRQAQHYGVDPTVIALTWLLRHPAGIVPIVGSTTLSRIEAALRALDVDYEREDWYRLLEARDGHAVA